MRSLAGWAIVLGSAAATAAAAQPAPPPAAALAQAAFASSAASGADGPEPVLDQQTSQRAPRTADWNSGQLRLSGATAGVVDTLHFGAARSLIGPSGLPLAPGQSAETAQVYE